MSTMFGVKIPSTNEFDEFDSTVEVAHRTHYIRWTNELAQLLPDDTPVIPLDNTAQGIYTIGDIKNSIKNQ